MFTLLILSFAVHILLGIPSVPRAFWTVNDQNVHLSSSSTTRISCKWGISSKVSWMLHLYYTVFQYTPSIFILSPLNQLPSIGIFSLPIWVWNLLLSSEIFGFSSNQAISMFILRSSYSLLHISFWKSFFHNHSLSGLQSSSWKMVVICSNSYCGNWLAIIFFSLELCTLEFMICSTVRTGNIFDVTIGLFHLLLTI